MQKKIIILLLLIVGVNLNSKSLYAFNNPHKSTKAKSDCCKFHNKDSDHDFNKKCTHYKCAFMSINTSYVGTNKNTYYIKTL